MRDRTCSWDGPTLSMGNGAAAPAAPPWKKIKSLAEDFPLGPLGLSSTLGLRLEPTLPLSQWVGAEWVGPGPLACPVTEDSRD